MNLTLRRTLSLTAVSLCALVAACESTGGALEKLQESGLLKSAGGALTSDEITAGLKEALTKGSEAVVSKLGAPGGFSKDPAVHIPLPASLAKARDFAARVGLDSSFNELEGKLNEAAEAATPKAKSLFVGAIKEMSVADAKGILSGPDNAATKYFEDKTRTSLAGEMTPLVDKSLAEVGAVSYFNTLMSSYSKIPFAPKVDANLTSHVVDKGMDGIFAYLAKEEKAIRENPVERTSALLKKVFAAR